MQEDYYEEMGASQSTPSQAEAPKPEPNKESNNTEEKPTEAKPSETIAKEAAEKAAPLSHNNEAILKDADSPIEKSSLDRLYDQLHAGELSNQKGKKYLVDKKSNGYCFFLYARNLSITWAADSRYWQWPYLKETSGLSVDVAELLNVCWLEVHGKFETTKLSPGTLYEVAFEIMLKDPAYGWEVPVNVRLILPDGNKQEHKENLMKKPRGQWIEIPVGEFVTSQEKTGEIEFSIYEYEGGMWKRGLLIKGVAIRPKCLVLE